jgi:uncharacterized membrane protein YfcA
LVKYIFQIIQNNYDYKTCIASDTNNERFIYLNENLPKFVFVSFVAGVISGMVGVGGGMFSNPLFLSMGIDPKVSTSFIISNRGQLQLQTF